MAGGRGGDLSGEHLPDMCTALTSVTSTRDKRNKTTVRPDVAVCVSAMPAFGDCPNKQTTTEAVRPGLWASVWGLVFLSIHSPTWPEFFWVPQDLVEIEHQGSRSLLISVKSLCACEYTGWTDWEIHLDLAEEES